MRSLKYMLLPAVFVLLLNIALPRVANGQQDDTASDGSAALEEVIVTARRRAESLQEVPVSASAYAEEALHQQQISGFEDMHLAAPNMSVTRNLGSSNRAQVFIRGIGRDNATWNEESGVAIYLDDMYINQPFGALFDMLDFERIEVLRGPQGTLYGRNATSGAVKFIGHRPQLDEWGFRASAVVGSFDRLDIGGAVSGPLVEGKSGFRLDFGSRSNDGYMNWISGGEELNGRDTQMARAALTYEFSDKVESYLVGYWLSGSDDINLPTSIFDPGGTGQFVPTFGDNFTSDTISANDNDHDSWSLSHTLTWNINADLALKSITSFREVDDYINVDGDGLSLVLFEVIDTHKIDTFTQEFQIDYSIGDRLELIAGIYFFDESLAFFAWNGFLGGIETFADQDTESFAAFADLSWSLTDQLRLSVGGRHTRDEKSVVQSAILPDGTPLFAGASGERSWSRFTPRVGIDYTVDDTLYYASYSEGYRGGTVIGGRPVTPDTATTYLDPEEAKSIELGIKTQLADDRVRLSASYFQIEYENLQASFRDTVTQLITVVAADNDIQGLELEVTALPTENLMFYLSSGYLDSEWKNVPPEHPASSRPDAQLKQVPEFHYKLGGSYTASLAAGSLTFGANYLWSEEIPRDIQNAPSVTTPRYNTLDAFAAFTTYDDKWRLTLGGRNLTDEEYWTMGVNSLSRWYAPEATWSLELIYRTM